TQHDPLPGTPKKSGARKTTAKSTAPASQRLQAYQLHVALEGVHPKVWRRLLVPVTIKLPLLHAALLEGMGWSGGHLHEFVFADERYSARYPGWDMLEDVQDESSVTLQQALGTRKTFTYVYDFGDDWCHKVKVEKIIPLDAPLSLAVCLDGKNACPPDDVGGPPGYEEFLQALADPAHPDHEDLTEWIGGSFDPAEFSVAEVNARLKPAAT
ncbi:MAG: plasmid pRiA4b ORF-3 family protein, partial [Polaromonas sp.]